MLDDIRLASYPAESQQPGSPYEIVVTVDCERPYAEDATQVSESMSGGTGTIVNYGNRPLFPVWQIWGPFASVTITNTTDPDAPQFVWDESLPGAGAALTNAQYLEIDTFRNTVTKFSAGPVLSNAAAGIDMLNSEFFLIPPGSNAITVTYTGGNVVNNNSSLALINSSFA